MSTIAIVGTLISGALVLGIAFALMTIAKKLAPPAHEIAADPVPKKLPAPDEPAGDTKVATTEEA